MIGWLQERWVKLSLIFDHYWNRLIELVIYGLGGLLNKIASTLNTAWTWVQSYYSLARGAVTTALNTAWTWVQSYYNLARNAITSALSTAWGWVIYYHNQAISYYNTIKDWVFGLVLGYYNLAINRLALLRQELTDGFWSIIGTLRVLVDAALSLANAVKIYAELTLATWIDRIERTVDNFRQTWEAPLSNFFSDPASVVWGIIEAHLYEFLEYWLAEQMGSVKTELKTLRPPIGESRDWKVEDFTPITNGDFIWPTPSRVISGYRYLSHATHYGLDIALSMGTPVKAIMRGVITRASYDAGGYGYYVDITHPGGWWSRYAHLSKYLVTSGQSVNQGDIIGLGGSTGHSTGAHLHLEIKKSGAYVDPQRVLP